MKAHEQKLTGESVCDSHLQASNGMLWVGGKKALNETLKQLVNDSYLKMRKPLRELHSSFMAALSMISFV